MAAEKKQAAKQSIEKQSAEKKPAEKKLTEKSVTKKVAAKKTPAKKAGSKPSGEVNFVVPRGGQVIKYFNLTPAAPTKSKQGDWLFTEIGSSKDISLLRVGFELNPSALEREFERAILVVKMKQPRSAGGTWRFALGGVATDHADEDPSNDIAVDIIDNGFTMLVYVHALQNNDENLPFGFVASFTDSRTGAVSIYESQDPGIIVERPPRP